MVEGYEFGSTLFFAVDNGQINKKKNKEIIEKKKESIAKKL